MIIMTFWTKIRKGRLFGSRIKSTKECSLQATLLVAALAFPSISLADQLAVATVVYGHMTPDRVVSVYRDAYAKSGLVRFSRRITDKEVYPGNKQRMIEIIRLSKPSSRRDNEYVLFSIDAYTKDGICIDCAVSKVDYSFKNYEEDWRATRRIRQALGQSLAPVCDATCPASVKDWVNNKSDEAPVHDTHRAHPDH